MLKFHRLFPKYIRTFIKKNLFYLENYSDKIKKTFYESLLIFKKVGINIGSGSKFHLLFWKNYDLFYGDNINSNFKLDFKDESFQICYTSHFIEHCDDETFYNLSKEVYRVLKKKEEGGGVFAILTPNFDLLKRSYENRDIKLIETDTPNFFKQGWPGWKENNIVPDWNTWICHWFANYSNIPMQNHRPWRMNYILPPVIKESILIEKSKKLSTIEFGKFILEHVPFEYRKNGGHINYYTFEKLEKILNNIGFKTYLSSYENNNLSLKKNEVLNMLNKMHKRQAITLYVNAIKN
jgi:hypothetical protein